MRTSHFNGRYARIVFPLTAVYTVNPEMGTPRYSVKRTGFSAPLIPGLQKIHSHSIMRTVTSLSRKAGIFCQRRYMDIIIIFYDKKSRGGYKKRWLRVLKAECTNLAKEFTTAVFLDVIWINLHPGGEMHEAWVEFTNDRVQFNRQVIGVYMEDKHTRNVLRPLCSCITCKVSVLVA